MSTGFSLFLIAVGAILAWAVDYTVTGVDINMVGGILIAVGAVGLLLSLLFWSSFSPFPQGDPLQRRTRRVVASAPPPEQIVVRQPAPPQQVIIHEQAAPTERVVIREPMPPPPDRVITREQASPEPPADHIEPR